MSEKTKAQKDMELALKLVNEVFDSSNKQTQKNYGGLCHSFPVMVRQCGLCQALAFSESKKNASGDSDLAKAHELILKHAGKIIGQENILQAVRDADTIRYILLTRRILSAWIYFKRFAVSILMVEEGGNEQ